jgi:hypothetical protein
MGPTTAPEGSGSGGATPASGGAGTAPASAPLPTTSGSGRRDESKGKGGQCRAGLVTSARSAGPRRPFPPGAAALSLFPSAPFPAGPGRLWPPTSRHLRLPAGRFPRVREEAACEQSPARAVRKGSGRARGAPRAKGSWAREKGARGGAGRARGRGRAEAAARTEWSRERGELWTPEEKKVRRRDRRAALLKDPR